MKDPVSAERKDLIDILIVNRTESERESFRKALEGEKGIRIVGSAPNGNLGFLKVEAAVPDIIIFDMNVLDLSAVKFTEKINEKYPGVGIILSLRQNSKKEIVDAAMKALERGALDFVEIPESGDPASSLKLKLLPKLRIFSIKRYSRFTEKVTGKTAPGKSDLSVGTRSFVKTGYKGEGRPICFKVLVIGVSTGGPGALMTIIPSLPGDYPIPILIVLHIPKDFTATMAADLDRKSRLRVKEASDGEEIKPGTVYLAPGGMHMKIVLTSGRYCVACYDGPPENWCKPSVDVLFRSAARLFNGEVIAVLLTGMGEDGVKGMALLKEKGAHTIGQDKESSIVWGMPGKAWETGVIDYLLPLDQIAEGVTQFLVEK